MEGLSVSHTTKVSYMMGNGNSIDEPCHFAGLNSWVWIFWIVQVSS